MKNGIKSGKIWAEYSGINDGFSGYLVFEDDGKVVLASGDGYLQQKSNSLFQYRRILSAERPKDLPNVCKVIYPIEAEKEKNKESSSKVTIKY